MVLTNVDVLLVSVPKLQLILILAVVLVDLEMTSNFAPYIDDTDDVFADIAQWCVVAILLFSIALEVGAIRPESSGVGFIFVLLLFAIIIVFLGYGIDYAWESLRDVPKHLLSVSSRIAEKKAKVSNRISAWRNSTFEIRQSKAGLDPTPVNDEYFPELILNETNTVDAYGQEKAITEEEFVLQPVQAPNQKPTDHPGYSCLDSSASEYGLQLSWDMDDRNSPCNLFEKNSGN